MHVLLFTWFYPPYLSAGSSRLGQLAKYLARAGVRVSVVTGRPRDLPMLTDNIPASAEVHHAPHLDVNALPRLFYGRSSVTRHGYELSRLGRLQVLGRAYKQVVHFPDAHVGWVVPAARLASRLDRPDLVLSSSPSPSAHLAAALFALRRAIPWVAEYRDSWTDNPTFRRWWPARAVEGAIEMSLMSRASAVTATTASLAQILSDRFLRPVHHIPNGFDPEDFMGDVEPEPRLFAHAGTVYAGYTTKLLLQALPHVTRPLRILFAARNVADLPEQVRAAGSPEQVQLIGPLPRTEAIALIRRAEANLLFLWDPRHPLGHINVPQKLFEYLGARRPIIVIGENDGEAASILRASGLATFAPDPTHLARTLDDVPVGRPDPAVLRQYEYSEIAARFSAIFEEVIRRGLAGRSEQTPRPST